MAAPSTSGETVDRLKELLFDREARELDTLAERIAEIRELAGSEAQFQRSVAKVLDSALIEAEGTRHKELANAMAPMVLRTLRTEMRSGHMQDQIAGLMYPRVGEMIRRYVASAVRDMMQDINRRLEQGLSQNRLVLRLRSVVSGRSMAELALADTQRLEVEEIYLIRRGSGELIHRWERDRAKSTGAADEGSGAGAGASAGASMGGNRGTLVSGFLTAIMAFAEEAFEARQESLRTLDLDSHTIYVRGAPAHLLAVKCSGTAPGAVEQLIDGELIRVLAEHQRLEQAPAPDGTASAQAGHDRLLEELAERLEAGAAARARQLSKGHGFRTLAIVFWVVALPLLALLAWYAYVSWITSEMQQRADAALSGIPALAGYPVKAHVERGAGRIWVSGLVPDDTTRRLLLARLQGLARVAAVEPQLGVLPKADLDGRLDREALKRALDRARPRLQTMLSDLAAARGRLADPADREALIEAEEAFRGAAQALDGVDALAGAGHPAEDLLRWNEAVHVAGDRLAALAGTEPVPRPAPPADAAAAVDGLTLAADRVSGLVARLDQRRQVTPLAEGLDSVQQRLSVRTAEVEQRSEQRVATLDRRVDERVATLDRRLEERILELERRLAALAPAPPTPHEQLKAFIIGNAVFFTNDTDYRDAAATGAMLDALAGLVARSEALLRVVGYTDEIGTSARNSPLSQARADKVMADLVARGAPPGRLIAVGRPIGFNLSPGAGPESSNRRVEFELGFRGERGAP